MKLSAFTLALLASVFLACNAVPRTYVGEWACGVVPITVCPDGAVTVLGVVASEVNVLQRDWLRVEVEIDGTRVIGSLRSENGKIFASVDDWTVRNECQPRA